MSGTSAGGIGGLTGRQQITMRQSTRHPAEIPIEVQSELAEQPVGHSTRDVGFGGLAFSSNATLEPGTLITLRIPYLQPAFEAIAARVAWCDAEGARYVVGVQFADADIASRMQMVEQVCHIQSYRRYVEQYEGRRLTPGKAAEEWISRYASPL